MPDFLVTGTDTGVGKTVIAAAIVHAMRARGLRAVGFKPVESGVTAGAPTDASILAHASGQTTPLAVPIASLAEPLAPAVAADRAGIVIDPAAIEARVRALQDAGFSVVVEGAGGVMVPLAWDYTAVDLARACNLTAIVVARAGLGTLNHVLMTISMLRGGGVAIGGVVFNGRRTPPDLAETTNPAALARLLPDVRLLEISHTALQDPIAHATQNVIPWLTM